MTLAPLAPFPDVREALGYGLETHFPGELAPYVLDGQDVYRVGSRFPPEGPLLGGRFVRVGGIGGPDDLITHHGTYDIDVFAPTYSQGWDLAQRIHQWVMRYPRRIEFGARSVVLDTVRVSMSPQEVDWVDSRVRRFYSSYQISARR